MSNQDDDILYVIFGFILVLPSAAWSGFVLTKLWAWFIVPLGVIQIETWHAAGIFLVASWATGLHSKSDDDDDKDSRAKVVGAAIKAAVIPAVMWVIGAIYHALM